MRCAGAIPQPARRLGDCFRSGRIQRAYDKTNGYDFVYYNEVIKPALVGLTGPWISGGIEFNWPQHH
ncbi:MAG: DUF5107 domain-containing protein, partial [Clostridia bacterium]|nr:DUF5107 domain-containing protein [Clostridia bacterium]